MNYESLSSNVKDNFDEMLTQLANVDSVSSIWSGDASNALTDDLNMAVKNITRQQENIDTFCSVLGLLEDYKANKKMIEMLKNSFENLSDKKEAEEMRKEILEKINRIRASNRNLKKNMVLILSTIEPVRPSFREVTYSVSQNNSYKEYSTF